jgi:parvulin-like peptidyl-prolyl isomerase
MTNQQNVTPASQPGDEYRAGKRSITQRRGKSRFEMVREKKARGARGRPFVMVGGVLLLGLIAILVVAFVREYVIPPRQLAIQVGDVKYSRGDVVDLIRFNQRLSEELGIPFQLGTSVFDVLLVIQQAELSYQVAPSYGVTVDRAEVDERISYILGLSATSDAELSSEEYQANVAEAKRKFLNRVGLPESVWRDFLTKIIFQERLRGVVSDTVPRIQPQMHVYEILIERNDPQLVAQIDRELKAGKPVDEVALQFSADPDIRRTRGEVGWIPQGMLAGQYDRLLFGTDQNGQRILPYKSASVPQFDSQRNMFTVVVVNEFQEARELSSQALETLTDSAFTTFLNNQRGNYYLFLDLDSDIANWINKQVSLAAIVPTPGASTDPLQGLLPSSSGTAVPTPDGIPGLSLPVN